MDVLAAQHIFESIETMRTRSALPLA